MGRVPPDYYNSAVGWADNPVVITTVRQTGVFGRYHRDRRKTPSPTLIGDYRVFPDRLERPISPSIRHHFGKRQLGTGFGKARPCSRHQHHSAPSFSIDLPNRESRRDQDWREANGRSLRRGSERARLAAPSPMYFTVPKVAAVHLSPNKPQSS